MKTVYFVILLLSAISTIAQDKQHNAFTDVSVQQFKHLIDSLQGEVVVDLRTPEELRRGKIPGAIVIDFFGPDFEPSIEALDKNKVYLLYCASGGRSGETLELMQKKGFQKVYNLEGGFTGWAKAKMPIVKH